MNVADIKEAVRDRDGRRCVECLVPEDVHVFLYGQTLEVHRIIPGSCYTLDGCVTLCLECHKTKPKSTRGAGKERILHLSAAGHHHAKMLMIMRGYPTVSAARFIEDLLAAEYARTEFFAARVSERKAAHSAKIQEARSRGASTRRLNEREAKHAEQA